MGKSDRLTYDYDGLATFMQILRSQLPDLIPIERIKATDLYPTQPPLIKGRSQSVVDRA